MARLEKTIPIAAWSVILIASTVIYGWVTHNHSLIQIYPSWVPMQINTALCIAACGWSLLYYSKKHFIAATVFSVLPIGIAVLTLIQYLSGYSLGIDEFFFQHYLTTQTSSPGRMAPNTALASLFSGLGLLFLCSSSIRRHSYLISSVCGTMVASLSSIALIGYINGISGAYGWGSATRMAVHTASAFSLIGFSLIIAARKRESLTYATSQVKIRQIRIHGIIIISTVLVVLMQLIQQSASDSMTAVAGLQKAANYTFEVVAAIGLALVLLYWKFAEVFINAKVQVADLARKQRELEISLKRILLLQKIDAALAHSRNKQELISGILKQLTQDLNWEAAHYWDRDRAKNHLIFGSTFLASSQYEPFTTGSKQYCFKSGVGLPGRVFESKTAAHITDVRIDPNFPRASLAQSVHLAGAFAFPIISSANEVVGVMEFFSKSPLDQLVPTLLIDFAQVSRRIGEALLRLELEAELRQVTGAIENAALVATTDVSGTILEANDNFCSVSGFKREELIGNNHRMISSGLHSRVFWQNVFKVILSGQTWSGLIHNRKKSGQLYSVQSVISPLKNAEGKINRFLSIRFDVTKQIETEKLLEEAQSIAKIGSWSFDLTTGQISWSKQMFEMFPENVDLGPPTYERHFSTIHPDDQEHWKTTVESCLQSGTPYTMRFRSLFPDKEVWVEALGRSKFDQSGKVIGLYGTCQDVTERVRLNIELDNARLRSIQNSKLATLGEMAAGIAHEVNNPLAIIAGSVNQLVKFAHDPEKFATKIASIDKACGRITKIVNGLKKFSRSHERATLKFHSLCEIVKESLILTESKSKRHDTELTFEPSVDARILCDEAEIEQVLVNLINNAIDAVGSRQERWVRVSLVEGDEEVILRVIDSGHGVPENIRAKLFEPFFTTKEVGEGTGLGLSVTKGILDDHHATIRVLAESRNTCFEIRFPKVQDTHAAA